MSLNETLSKLELILTSVTKDLQKVNRGNKSAAQRVRVGTLRLEKVGKQFRKESVEAAKVGKFKKKRVSKKGSKKTKKRKR